jgi:hypothetical protein
VTKKKRFAIELEAEDGLRALHLMARLRHADLPPELQPERAYLVRILDAVRAAAGVPAAPDYANVDASTNAWREWAARRPRPAHRPRSVGAFPAAFIALALFERCHAGTKSAAVAAAKRAIKASVNDRTVFNELRRLQSDQPRSVRDLVLKSDSEMAKAFEKARSALGKNQRRI